MKTWTKEMLLERINRLPDSVVITDLNHWQEFYDESYDMAMNEFMEKYND
jgi:hypothetical protein